MKQMTFLQKIKLLKDYEIVELMIKAIENPVIKFDFNHFRKLKTDKNNKVICVGCAAVNMLYKLTSKPNIKYYVKKDSGFSYDSKFDAKRLNIEHDYMFMFEFAINELRTGDIEEYNDYAKMLGMSILPEFELPILNNERWKINIQAYKDYAKYLKEKHDTH